MLLPSKKVADNYNPFFLITIINCPGQVALVLLPSQLLKRSIPHCPGQVALVQRPLERGVVEVLHAPRPL